MRPTRRVVLLSSVIALACVCVAAGASTLEEELGAVDQLRAGRATPFEEVERRCSELLQRYTSPEEQALIYFQLAQVEGQSGVQSPEKLVTYVKKALQLPLDPVKQLRLYIYWGDAIQIAHSGVSGGELAAARREAVMPYLQGLKQALMYDLPDERPRLPSVPMATYAGPTDTEGYEGIRRWRQEQAEARRKAVVQWRMTGLRDILMRQISFMYSRFPFATDELRALATEVVGDEAAVERLVSQVEAEVQKRLDQMVGRVLDQVEVDVGVLGTSPVIVEDEDVQPASSDTAQAPATPPVASAKGDHQVPMRRYNWRGVVLLATTGAVVLVVAILLRIRRSRKSAAQ